MGRKLDILLRRTFKASKLKTLLALALSRVAVLQNQRQVRCSQTRNDVLQLLQLGQHERALLRVEHLIKDQNMLDVFVMIEGYCHLLTERAILVEQHKECPQELKEAVASLIFAASRCGDFPELQELRMVFTTRFGKEFAAAAVELRNSCGVNHKMIQKTSTKLPSFEIRLKVVKEIAAEVGITVNIEEPPIGIAEVDSNLSQSQTLLDQTKSADMGGSTNSSVNAKQEYDAASKWDQEKRFSDSTKARKYTDVASAAQAAFESAAYAAAAARAAVELSRSESQDRGSDDQSSPSPRRRTAAERTRNDGSSRLRSEYTETPTRNTKNVRIEHFNGEKMHPIQNFSSESETEEVPLKQKDNGRDDVKGKYKENRGRFKSGSSSESIEFVSEEKKQQGKSIFFDESEEESEKELDKISLERNDFFFEGKSSFETEENKYYSPRSNKQSNHRGRTRELDANFDSEVSDESKGTKLHYHSPRNTQEVSRADSIDSFHENLEKVGLKSRDEGNFVTSYPAEKYKLQTGHLNSKEKQSVQYSSVGRVPDSVRTRRNF